MVSQSNWKKTWQSLPVRTWSSLGYRKTCLGWPNNMLANPYHTIGLGQVTNKGNLLHEFHICLQQKKKKNKQTNKNIKITIILAVFSDNQFKYRKIVFHQPKFSYYWPLRKPDQPRPMHIPRQLKIYSNETGHYLRCGETALRVLFSFLFILSKPQI